MTPPNKRAAGRTPPRRNWPKALVAGIAAMLTVAAAALAIAQNTPPAIKLVDLQSEPLYALGASAKPTLTLALSVEFPTVGAQYRDAYDAASTYIGYFDSDSCYQYSTTANTDTTGYFIRAGAANGHACGNAFSGNFMNWASSSAIDILRRGLTGGDRIIDEPSQTVLQRAILPDGSQGIGSFWNNGSYFPSKSVTAQQAAGAIPAAYRVAGGNVYIANCLNKISLGSTQEGSCDAPGKNGDKGIFLARVQVCDSTGATLTDPRAILCQRYPSGYYKPVGNLQKNADKIRVAAFGYLLAQNSQRYGGVLRAKMRYVGIHDFDANGAQVTGANALAEWIESTGVFNANPEGDASGNSGVINYLNKFGRTGTVGKYKSNDPVSELYYEALRYVQGLPPTPEAVEPATDDMKAGFAYYGNYGPELDPHKDGTNTADYSCLRNNILTVGDIFVHNDNYIPGNTRTGPDAVRPANPDGNEPDFRYWTDVVGGFESGTEVGYDFNGNPNLKTSNPSPTSVGTSLAGLGDKTTGSGGTGSYYMAGMAYWAHTHDIRGNAWKNNTAAQRPGMRVTTYALDVNENSASSNASTRYQTQYFLAAKYGGFMLSDIKNTDPKKETVNGNPFTMLDPDGKPTNAPWQKATEPGEAKTYFLASSAQAVLDGLDEIFASAVQGGNSIAGAAISQQRLTAEGGYVFNTTFDPATWTGNLIARPITVNDQSGTASVADAGTTGTWDAQAKLDGRKTPRNIVMGSPSGGATPFNWSQLPDSTQKNLLSGLLDLIGQILSGLLGGSPSATLGPAQVDYLAGNRSHEAGYKDSAPLDVGQGATLSFRSRTHLLGDIVNAPVTYSGAPTDAISLPGYKGFYDTNKNRVPAVFVGANDGMLHAFNASAATSGGGDELFAYIPSWFASSLGSLSATNYGSSADNPHKAFVDGASTVGEAQLTTDASNSQSDPTTWKTVLIGATGAGGQGVFALDVTNPAAFTKDSVLWEFTDKNDADLGNVVGKPQILKFKIANASATTPAKYKWYAVVASGVNNSQADGSVSTTGRPALFLLSLNKSDKNGVVSAQWTENVNYFKLSLPADTTLNKTMAPGLVNFTAVGGVASEVAAIYMGDLQGRMWKLDFALQGIATNGALNWTFKQLVAYGTNTDNGQAPLFVAKDAFGAPQPITMSPTVIAGPKKDTAVVLFGTGKFLEPADKVLAATTQRQSVYAIYDDDEVDVTDGAHVKGRAALAQGTVNAAKYTVTTPAFTWGMPMDGNTALKAGWYFDFANARNQGERQINDFAVFGPSAIFGSLLPPGGAQTPCSDSGGNIYNVNFATGDGGVQVSTVGLLSTPIVLELRDKITTTTSTNTGRALTTRTGQGLLIGSKGTQVTSTTTAQSISRRMSWRQIENYRELRGKQ